MQRVTVTKRSRGEDRYIHDSVRVEGLMDALPVARRAPGGDVEEAGAKGRGRALFP